MEIKLTVPAKYIAVLKLFAAHKDIRYYLNSIKTIDATYCRYRDYFGQGVR